MMLMEIRRIATNQDISWFLDLERTKQLDLDPPYQRKSVWTSSDRKFFLDTIFRGYPSPAIFLNKVMSKEGEAIYHVVDGKQRLETILKFSRGEIKIANDFGSNDLDGKKWEQISGELKQKFWDYTIPVEMINFNETRLITEVFDRLNRNSKRLTRQELRHAKFDGWFTSFVEEEINESLWRTVGLEKAREDKRMDDVQRLSELMLIILEKKILDFDQDDLDSFYGKYDDIEDETDSTLENDFNRFEFKDSLESAKNYLTEMVQANKEITMYTKTMLNLYSLWSVIVLDAVNLPNPKEASKRYIDFMNKITNFKINQNSGKNSNDNSSLVSQIKRYYSNSQGASTDLKKRQERYYALRGVITGNENPILN